MPTRIEAIGAAIEQFSGGTSEADDAGSGPQDGVGPEGGGGLGDTSVVADDSKPVVGDGAGQESASAAAQRARDEAGRYAKEEAKAKPPEVRKAVKPSPIVTTKPPLQGAATQTATPVQPVQTETYKAPGSWPVAVREKFAGLPPEVQALIVKRESEMADGVRQLNQKTGDATKGFEAYEKAVAPYRQMIQATGTDPAAAVSGALQMVHSLQYGNAQTQARTVATIIKQLNLDPNLLVSALDEGGAAPSQPQHQFQDPRVDQLLARYEQQEAAAKQRAQFANQQELESFGSDSANEFFQDVRPQMAAVLSAGLAKTLKDAYAQACWMNPEVRNVIQGREKQEAAKAAQAHTQQARNASSSLKSQPAGNGTASSGKNSRRSALEAAVSSYSKG